MNRTCPYGRIQTAEKKLDGRKKTWPYCRITILHVVYYRVDIYCFTYSAVRSFSAVRFGRPVFIYSAIRIRPYGIDSKWTVGWWMMNGGGNTLEEGSKGVPWTFFDQSKICKNKKNKIRNWKSRLQGASLKSSDNYWPEPDSIRVP